MGGQDKRKHRRVKATRTAAAIRDPQRVVGDNFEIENISLGGLFVRCEEPLPLGSHVLIELRQPSLPDSLRLFGVTVSARDAVEALTRGGYPGMGIRFEALTEETTRKLSALLVELTRRKDAEHLGAYNPALIDESVALSRNAFDFGFVTLDALPEERAEPTAPAPVRSTPLPSAPQARPPKGVLGRPVRREILSPPRAPPAAASGRTGLKSANGPPLPVLPDESALLRVQVRGLLADLGETKDELSRRASEMEHLRAELQRARDALAERERRIRELEQTLAGHFRK